MNRRFLVKFKMLQFGHLYSNNIDYPWRIIGYEKNPDYNIKADDDSGWNPFLMEEYPIVLALVEVPDSEKDPIQFAAAKVHAQFIPDDLEVEEVGLEYEWEDPDRAKAAKELMAFSKSRALAEKQPVLPEIPLFFVLRCHDTRIKTQIIRSKKDWNRISHLVPDNLKQMLIDMMATCVPVLTFWFVAESDNMKQFLYDSYKGEGGRLSPFYGKRPYVTADTKVEYMFYDDGTLDTEAACLLSTHLNIPVMIPVKSLVGVHSRLEGDSATALLEEFR